ncbi:hypothetical protein IT774_14760 [Salinimonas marina]|uniref:Uncharacterized protein n=1 Tax=Salinimonas marina TaxID=2785918 RepID=A0A7S9DWN3_9ALTE|nr:hypothetical protein [Salinimonas marina]QPG05349.1 hypothetical protein IT774_14760 [Salinimonas marina]
MDSIKKVQLLSGSRWWPLTMTVLAATGTCLWYVDAPAWWWLFPGGPGVLVVLGWALSCRQQQQQPEALGSPWLRLRFHGDKLWIDKNSYPKASIDMVVMGKHHGRAWLQILFHDNTTEVAQFSFAELYFPAVEAFLRLRLPMATINVISEPPAR